MVAAAVAIAIAVAVAVVVAATVTAAVVVAVAAMGATIAVLLTVAQAPVGVTLLLPRGYYGSKRNKRHNASNISKKSQPQICPFPRIGSQTIRASTRRCMRTLWTSSDLRA